MASGTTRSRAKRRRTAAVSVVLCLCAVAFASTADAAPRRPRHHHRPVVAAAPPAPRAIPHEYSFYPERVEGGVPGNLPFNNQIRKMVDPLNANGAGR